MRYLTPVFVTSAVIGVFTLSAAAQLVPTSSFTYQGRLKDSNANATGNYDFSFTLWDDPSAGAQVAGPVIRTAVPVSSAVFTVSLDFGYSAFPGAPRYLEISVRPTGSGPYMTLSPRQEITSAPYAIRSASAAAAGDSLKLGGTAADQFVQTSDSRLSDARTPTAGSANYIQNRTTQQTSANFNIDGTGKANVVDAATQYNIGGGRVLTANATTLVAGIGAGTNNTGTNNTFVGASAGQSTTTGGDNSFFGTSAGVLNTGDSNAFFGANAGENNTTGGSNTFLGWFAGQNVTTGGNNVFVGRFAGARNDPGSFNTAIGTGADMTSNNLAHATAIGAGATVSQSNTIALGRADGTDLVQIFRLGTSGTTPLCVNANHEISTGCVVNIISAAAPTSQLVVQQDQSNSLLDLIKAQQQQIDALKALVCSDHPTATVCKQ